MLIEMTQTEDIRIIRLANGGANILSISNGMAAALFDAFNDALTYPSCKAIIIAGAGRMFCGGADLKDLPIAGELRDIFDAIEQSAKPVVVAMHGMALGGAVELAMAGHGRIAHSDTRFSLPEVNLGLLPGLGGTQRLPRLVGAEAALEMMLAGKTINAEEALAAGYADMLADDPLASAIEVATKLAQKPGHGSAVTKTLCNGSLSQRVRAADAAGLEAFLDSWFSTAAQQSIQALAAKLAGK